MTMTPEELWSRARNGDQISWQRLYELFGGKVYQFFLKNTRNPELSGDKVQEVFLRIFRHKESFQYGSLKTWIFRIARNILIDEWRKTGKKEILCDTLPEIADSGMQVEEEVIAGLEHGQMVSLIDECLDGLEHNERMLIGLVYLGGLTISEVAQVMEIPLGTAKTRVRHARLKLDAMLNEKMSLKRLKISL